MILPEHGGESVFQQDYLRGMQYNVYAKALFAPFGNQNHTLHTCGNGGAAGEERLGNQRITAICAGYVGVLLLFIYAQYVPVIVVG